MKTFEAPDIHPSGAFFFYFPQRHLSLQTLRVFGECAIL